MNTTGSSSTSQPGPVLGAQAAGGPLEFNLNPLRGDGAGVSVYLPEKTQRTGVALLICPGGGYAALSIDCEGHDAAGWYARHGIAAIVLRYRLPTPVAGGCDAPLEDAHSALRLIRAHAHQWSLDADKVGILGFSAGGHLAATAGTHYDQDTRPDFMLLVYAVISMGLNAHTGSRRNLLGLHPTPEQVHHHSPELHVTTRTPPTFLAHADDDRGVSPLNSVNFYLALHAAGVPAELHIYQSGDHGMRGGKGYGIGEESLSIASTWPMRSLEWMRQRAILKP